MIITVSNTEELNVVVSFLEAKYGTTLKKDDNARFVIVDEENHRIGITNDVAIVGQFRHFGAPKSFVEFAAYMVSEYKASPNVMAKDLDKLLKEIFNIE